MRAKWYACICVFTCVSEYVYTYLLIQRFYYRDRAGEERNRIDYLLCEKSCKVPIRSFPFFLSLCRAPDWKLRICRIPRGKKPEKGRNKSRIAKTMWQREKEMMRSLTVLHIYHGRYMSTDIYIVQLVYLITFNKPASEALISNKS